MSDDPKPLDTAVPQINFTLTSAERVGALVGGVPAWAARRRRIEDLHAELCREVPAAAHKEGRPLSALPTRLERKLEALNELIDKHNRYFPVEANLPMDPRTGRLLEGSEPWRPMARKTADEYLALR